MKQYFYIPKTHEVALSNDINSYLSIDSNNFSIVNGVYQTTLDAIDTLNSLVTSRLVTGEIQNIINGYESQGIKRELIGYILEGNLQDNFPEFYSIIQSLPDCLIFNTNIECLSFLNTLN